MSLILNPHRFVVPGGGGGPPSLDYITAKDAGSTSATVDFTGQVSANDLLLVHVQSYEPAAAVNTPSGFAHVTGSPKASGVLVETTLFSKIASGSETTVTVDGTTDHVLAFGTVWSGVDATTPINATATKGGYSTGSVVTSPGLTTSVDDCIVAQFCGVDYHLRRLSSVSNSSLANLAERYDDKTTIGNGGTICMSSGELASAGSSGATTMTFSNTVEYALIEVAIAPS